MMPGKGRGGSNENAIFGTSSDDILDGRGGDFTLSGGRGNDTYIVDQGDVVIEKNKGGDDDTIIANSNWTLGDHIEHLILDGSGDLSGTGNALGNTILGNDGANLLTGGAGSDTLDGGAGIDSARFAGNRADYAIAIGETTVTVTHIASGDTDTLTNIELLAFEDQTIDLAPGPLLAAENDAGQTTEDQSFVIDLLANDTGDSLQIVALGAATLGTVTNNGDGTVTYVPFADANGIDGFDYTIRDASGAETSASVEVEIQAVNDAPVAEDDTFDAAQQLSGAFNVLTNDLDLDGDTLFVASAGASAEEMSSVEEADGHLMFATANGGSVEIHPDGSFSYVAASGFVGVDSFTYLASDTANATAMATVEIEVVDTPTDPPNDDLPYYVDALLLGDIYRLNYGEEIGTSVTVKYAFANEVPDYYDATWNDGFLSFSSEQRENTVAALNDISSFSGITFVETTVEDAEMVFGMSGLGFSGLAYLPLGDGTGNTGSDVWLDEVFADSALEPGTTGHNTLIHEIGHALGLIHPDLPDGEENQQYSIMASTRHATADVEEASTFMSYDIAALQHLYGANETATAGNDVYSYQDLEESIQTIWDAGGHDVIDMSAANEGVTLDLTEGGFSSIGATSSDNVSIAFGADIEDAIGSAHDDVIIGNDLDNVIDAAAGNDVLTGGAGADTYRFHDASGHNVITDFDVDEDRIDLTDTDFTLEDLTTSLVADGVSVQFGSTYVTLQGVESEDGHEDWFQLT